MIPTIVRSLAVVVLGWLACCYAGTARAEMWFDPESPMTWEGMLACELVIVGKYRSHQGSDLILQVDEVLKGSAKQGQLLAVKLEHLYTVETGAVAWESGRTKNGTFYFSSIRKG